MKKVPGLNTSYTEFILEIYKKVKILFIYFQNNDICIWIYFINNITFILEILAI